MSDNYTRIEFLSKSSNESFARVAAAAFASQLDPTVEEIADIKTAVSEAVTNAIVHGYRGTRGNVVMECRLTGNTVEISVEDFGCGIDDVEKAKEPLFTTHSDEERSGMGFTVMEMFMDSMDVTSKIGEGTKVIMTKKINAGAAE